MNPATRAHLMAESERLLDPAAPQSEPEAAPTAHVLLDGEEHLTLDDWDLLESEPPYRREGLRRALIDQRRREADAPQQGRQPVPAAWERSLAGFARGLADRILSIRDDLRRADSELAARASQLERQVADLEARLSAMEDSHAPK